MSCCPGSWKPKNIFSTSASSKTSKKSPDPFQSQGSKSATSCCVPWRRRWHLRSTRSPPVSVAEPERSHKQAHKNAMMATPSLDGTILRPRTTVDGKTGSSSSKLRKPRFSPVRSVMARQPTALVNRFNRSSKGIVRILHHAGRLRMVSVWQTKVPLFHQWQRQLQRCSNIYCHGGSTCWWRIVGMLLPYQPAGGHCKLSMAAIKELNPQAFESRQFGLSSQPHQSPSSSAPIRGTHRRDESHRQRYDFAMTREMLATHLQGTDTEGWSWEMRKIFGKTPTQTSNGTDPCPFLFFFDPNWIHQLCAPHPFH